MHCNAVNQSIIGTLMSYYFVAAQLFSKNAIIMTKAVLGNQQHKGIDI